MVLKFYYDLLSQPSRTLYIFFKLANIPFEFRLVNLGAGEHLTKEFKDKYSKFQKLPFIHDGDFRLTESIAILRYLSREHQFADHWYPRDSKKQALVDEYLEWQHLNIRYSGVTYFTYKWMYPKFKGVYTDEKTLESHKKNLMNTLERFQDLFLTDGSRFMFGDQVSYADVAAACEIEQPRIAGYDARDYYPRIKEWIENVRQECNPIYDEAHKELYKLVAIEEKTIHRKL